MSWLRISFEDFCTVKTSTFKDIHAITLIAFFYDSISSNSFNFFNSINNNFELLFIQSRKHKSLEQSFLKSCFCFFTFGNNFWFKITLFIKITVNFSWNSMTSLFYIFLSRLYLFLFIWLTWFRRFCMLIIIIFFFQ